MKLVCKCNNLIDAESIKQNLEDAGIPANITGQEAYHLQLGALMSNSLGVWVFIDEQFNDAKAVLNNPDHRVYSAVNVERFYTELEQRQHSHHSNDFYKKIIYTGITLMLLLTLFVFILTVI